MKDRCQHGLEIQDENIATGEPGTYCASCVMDALYNGMLGIDMGIHPNTKRMMRNKAKAKRRKERGK